MLTNKVNIIANYGLLVKESFFISGHNFIMNVFMNSESLMLQVKKFKIINSQLKSACYTILWPVVTKYNLLGQFSILLSSL